MKTLYFFGFNTLEEVKKRYKELALKHHPDRGGDTATMQQINLEYESILKNPFYCFSEKTEEEQQEFIKYPEIINKIIGLDGILIEIIGDWIWISGCTYPHRHIFKEIGFYFAPKKAMWYYRPTDYKSSNKSPKTIEFIRNKYGSDLINNNSKIFVLSN